MSSFTTRMVIHEGTWNDYDNLHREMGARGFSRTIKSDTGKVYHLPDAEYDFSGNATREQVRALAEQAARAAAPRLASAQLVTESIGRTWKGLAEVVNQRAA